MPLFHLEDKPPKLGDDGQPVHVCRGDLRPGDVFFSYGDPEEFWVTRWVRIFDDGWYSHVSFFDGEHSLDATYAKKIKRRDPGEIVHFQRYLDVYRFVSDSGDELGTPGWESEPVTKAGQRYLGHGYGTHDAILAALLLLSGRVDLPGDMEDYVRRILSTAVAFLSELVYDDSANELITCSELPYRAYFEADPSPRYRIAIRGRSEEPLGSAEAPRGFRALAGGGLGYNVVRVPSRSLGDPELDRMAQEFVDLYRQVQPPTLRLEMQLEGDDLGPVASRWLDDAKGRSAEEVLPDLPVDADFVSPRDLYASLNLVEVGRAFPEDWP